MPVLAEQELDKLANEVVDDYLAGKARLDEAAAKVASQRGLNPHQIERLTQTANTQTFLRLMDQRKEAQEKDLLHEFEPIDARHVIKIVIDEAGVHIEGPGDAEECKCDDEDELPDEMDQVRHNTTSDEPVKVSSAPVEEQPNPRDQARMRARLEKLASVMTDQIHQASFVFEEQFDDLITRFRRRPEKYASFERDALAEYGDNVGRSLISMLRSKLRMPSLVEKAASEKTADYHVSDDSPELSAFEGLVHIVNEVDKLNDGVERIKTRCGR